MRKQFSRIAGYFNLSEINNLEDLKKQYYRLAKQFHPDAGGDVKTMQKINSEFDALQQKLANGQNLSQEEKDLESKINEVFREVIDSIIRFPNLAIEIIGNWIWVSGNTYPVRADLKAAGFLFASKKKMWFWRPDEYKARNTRGEMSIDEIRAKYGSEKVNRNYSSRYLNGISGLTQKLAHLQVLLRQRERISGIGSIHNNNCLG
jgi:hypothetical protein